MNQMVANIISAMVKDPRFSEAIKEKIGTAVDTADMEKRLEALQTQLRQALGTKSRLERQMDTLDVTDPYYDRKILDLQRRYDEQYGKIEDIEIQIEEVQSQIRSIRQEKISGDNIYQLLLAFDEVYNSATEAEQKEFMKAFIERIELFPEKRKDGCWIKNIVFNFPVPVNGEEVKELPLENETMLETVVLLGRKFEKSREHVYLDYEPSAEIYLPGGATYSEIKQWIQAEYDLKVSSLYVAQVKQKHGIVERECYNKPKSENAKQPKCPPEKEAAIEAALKHFKMI